MAPLTLDLKSPAVNLVLKWIKEGSLPRFDLLGTADDGVEPWSQDLVKKRLLSRFDFGGRGLELDLSGLELGLEPLGQLAEALTSDKALTGLRLAGCGLGSAGAGALTKALLRASALEVLVLRHNALGEEACEGLGALLERNTPLRSLLLGANRVGSAGAARLGEALRTNDFLTELDLSRNGISDEGAECIAAAVEVNPHVLETVDLSGNCISKGGEELLAAVFDSGCTAARLLLQSRGPLRRQPVEGDTSEQFTVRCLPNDVRILPGHPVFEGPEAAQAEGPAEAAGAEKGGGPAPPEPDLPLDVDFEQDDDELDVTFRVEGLREADRGLVAVTIEEKRLLVLVGGRRLVDAELFDLVQPGESSWTVRDGVLEVYLVKVGEGESWPGLFRD